MEIGKRGNGSTDTRKLGDLKKREAETERKGEEKRECRKEG